MILIATKTHEERNSVKTAAYLLTFVASLAALYWSLRMSEQSTKLLHAKDESLRKQLALITAIPIAAQTQDQIQRRQALLDEIQAIPMQVSLYRNQRNALTAIAIAQIVAVAFQLAAKP